MDVQVGISRLLRMGIKAVGHRIRQYLLSTYNTIEVDTKFGRVRGLQRKTVYDEELYYAFEGIPYAKPPLGKLRFRAPQPPEPWEGVLDCTTYRSKPMQRNMVLGLTEGSEDCLHLNVYVKSMQSQQPLPVIVWIYGGGFQKGEASRDFYGPDYFMKQQVVFVCLNYRLAALGFLSLKDPRLDVPGNAGLKDQVQALRWISQNIAHFNGDPNNITLMGESAGAASAHVMMTTEHTRGLFHKAILQSGCALSSWAQMPHNNEAYRLARRMGYKGPERDADVLEFLNKAPACQIAAHDQELITQEDKRNFVVFAFGLVVEPYITEHCVVPKPHKEMLSDAWGNNIPLIIGGTSFEGLLYYQITHGDASIRRNFEAIIPQPIREASSPEQLQQLVLRLKQTYFGDEQRTSMELLETLNILSHRLLWHDIHRMVMARSKYAPNRPTYLYRFDFDSPHFNHFRRLLCGDQVRGVAHADDLSYMFFHLVSGKLDKNSLEYRTIERMVGMWTSFAASDNPNCAAIAPAEWLPVQVKSNTPYKCLNINHILELMELPEADALAVWDTFYDKEDLY